MASRRDSSDWDHSLTLTPPQPGVHDLSTIPYGQWLISLAQHNSSNFQRNLWKLKRNRADSAEELLVSYHNRVVTRFLSQRVDVIATRTSLISDVRLNVVLDQNCNDVIAASLARVAQCGAAVVVLNVDVSSVKQQETDGARAHTLLLKHRVTSL